MDNVRAVRGALASEHVQAATQSGGEEGLRLFDRGEDAQAAQLIVRSMNHSHECFEAWGLVPPQAREVRQTLLNQGALAVRLTGAGGGGFWVAFWG